MTMIYTFRNRYETMLYQGAHDTEEEAWKAYWDHCRYPKDARVKENDERLGIRVTSHV